jgi:hypothetical protein
MAKVQQSRKIGPDGKEWNRTSVHLDWSAHQRDVELLNYCQEKLGCSRSEAIRTAVRQLAIQLAQVP